MPEIVRCSVICTVLNEERSLPRLLDSLMAQTRSPDEVILVDGGSRDRTVAVAEEYQDRLPLRVLVASGCNISEGRNLAIREASCRVIASTDAGVRLGKEWLEKLLEAFECGDGPAVVSGFFQADVQGVFQMALGATVLPLVDDINPDRFLPSSRSVAFLKEVWSCVEGYPEWLDYCEDLVFDLRLRAIGLNFTFAPGAIAHFQPRTSLTSFFRQYYRYARGDGKANLWTRRHVARYATYLVLVPGVLVLSAIHHPLWLLGCLAGGIIYCARPWQRLRYVESNAGVTELLRGAAMVPVIRLVGDVAKMVGYPVGRLWRLRNRSRDELRWRDVGQCCG